MQEVWFSERARELVDCKSSDGDKSVFLQQEMAISVFSMVAPPRRGLHGVEIRGA